MVGSPTKSVPPGRIYNPAAFANPPLYRFGNYGRDPGDIRGPGFASADWALWKEFYFKTPLAKEETTLQVLVETFDLFNRTNRQNPNNTADNPNAGLIFGILTPMRRMQLGLRLAW